MFIMQNIYAGCFWSPPPPTNYHIDKQNKTKLYNFSIFSLNHACALHTAM